MQDDRTGAILILNPPVATHEDACGLTCEETLDGRRMRVMLPDPPLPNDERAPPGSLGNLRPPSDMDARLFDAMPANLRVTSPFVEWGYVAQMDTGAGWVHKIVVELDGHVPRRSALTALESWTSRTLQWLEVWTRQNLSRPDPPGGLMPAMGVVHLADDGVAGPTRPLLQANVGAVHHLDLAANRDDWEKAIKLAAQEVDPPLEHRLLRDAEVQLGRGEQRLAVITAGTAVEIAMSKHLRSVGVNPGSDPTLGQVLRIARDQQRLAPSGLDYNRDIAPVLVAPRNDATHRAYDPTTAQTEAALDLATKLIRHFAPMEGYRARP
jgi:HEPN domain-containing protein